MKILHPTKPLCSTRNTRRWWKASATSRAPPHQLHVFESCCGAIICSLDLCDTNTVNASSPQPPASSPSRRAPPSPCPCCDATLAGAALCVAVRVPHLRSENMRGEVKAVAVQVQSFLKSKMAHRSYGGPRVTCFRLLLDDQTCVHSVDERGQTSATRLAGRSIESQSSSVAFSVRPSADAGSLLCLRRCFSSFACRFLHRQSIRGSEVPAFCSECWCTLGICTIGDST